MFRNFFNLPKCRSIWGFTQQVYLHDHNFEYFRSKDPYKNLVVSLTSDLIDCKFPGPNSTLVTLDKDAEHSGFFFHLSQRENVMKLSATQLKEILCLMANTKIDLRKYANALKYIDEKCALSVERWPLDLSLYVLDAWFIILGPKAFKRYYYSVITSMWSKKIKKCSKHNLVLMLYFIGMSKSSPPFLMDLLEDKLESCILSLNDEEIAIVCLSFFKTSTKIKSKLLLQKSCDTAKNLILKNNNFHLVSILKCLRLSKYLDGDLMKVLAAYVKNEYTRFNFVECTNFLATFATQNMWDIEMYDCIEKQAISLLASEEMTPFDKAVQQMHPSQRGRAKDIARFLWGLATVGHQLKKESIHVINNLISHKLSSGELESDLPALIDCLHSFILLNQYNQPLIEHVLSSSFKNKKLGIQKAKPKYQLYFIYTSLFIEYNIPEAKNQKFTKHIPKLLEKDVENRNGFQDLIHYLSDKPNTFTVCYILPHIMISGILIATDTKATNTDKSMHSNLINLIESGILSRSVKSILGEGKVYSCIEILDPSVCVKGMEEPISLMKTKIRQLKKLNMNVITLTPREIYLLKSNGFEAKNIFV